MTITIYIIMEPGADRPYLSTHCPIDYFRGPHVKSGAKLYSTEVKLADWVHVDGRVQTRGALKEVEEKP